MQYIVLRAHHPNDALLSTIYCMQGCWSRGMIYKRYEELGNQITDMSGYEEVVLSLLRR